MAAFPFLPLFSMDSSSTITLRPPVWALILAVAIGGGFYIWGKQIESRDHTPTTIDVQGEGKVTAVPDIAHLSFGMQTGPQKTAKDALAILQKNMSAVFDAVKKVGIDEKDIASEQFYLSPVYDYRDGQSILRGYQANQSLSVKVRDLDKTSDVLTAATAAGANQAGDVNFTIDDPEALQAQARDEAITKAKEKALKLASQLGMTIVRVKSFSEGSPNMPGPMYMMKAESAPAADTRLPLPPGQQDVIVDVNVTYELK
jgi:hypothetical protein